MTSKLLTLRGALLGGAALGLLSIIGAAAAQAGPTLGNTVIVTSNSPATGDTADISFTGHFTNLDVYSAPEFLSGTFGPTGTETGFTNLLAYCTDLYNASGPATYTVGSLTSSNQPNSTPILSTTQVNEITTLIDDKSHTDLAATQLAIWSVEYGSAFSFSNASGNTGSDATLYLSELDGSAPQGVTLYQLQSTTAQGFSYTVDPVAVTEPMSMALLGVGMVGLSAVRRRQTRRPQASA